MHRIDNGTQAAALPATPDAVGTPGYFQDCDASAGVPGTVMDAKWANAVQEEIASVIEGTPVAPLDADYVSPTDSRPNAQMRDAILHRIEDRVRILFDPPPPILMRPGVLDVAARTYPDLDRAHRAAAIYRSIDDTTPIVIDAAGTFTGHPAFYISTDGIEVRESAAASITMAPGAIGIVTARRVLFDGLTIASANPADQNLQLRAESGAVLTLNNCQCDLAVVAAGGGAIRVTGTFQQSGVGIGLWAFYGGDIEMLTETADATVTIAAATGGTAILADSGRFRLNGSTSFTHSINLTGGLFSVRVVGRAGQALLWFNGASRLLTATGATPLRVDAGEVRGAGVFAPGSVINGGLVLAGLDS